MGACLGRFSRRLFACGRRSAWSPRFRRVCCSCCGMYDALFHSSEEEDAASAESGPLSQSVGLLDGTSATVCASPADTRSEETLSSLLRHGKNCIQTQIGETHYREGLGISSGLVIDRAKVTEQNIEQKYTSNLPPSSKGGKSEAITSLRDDEDTCPTCLEGYDKENPKIITKCNHHFHLACILRWMERSIHCPFCYQKMEFSESP